MNCPNDDSLYAMFGRVIRIHYSRIHVLLEKVGVYPGQPPLFFALGRHEGQSQKELAEKLYIKPATVTVMLNRMEAVNLVERRPDPNDQRVLRIYLTEQGKQVWSNVKEVHKEIEAECFKNFTDEEKILLRRFFMQMRDNLVNAFGDPKE